MVLRKVDKVSGGDNPRPGVYHLANLECGHTELVKPIALYGGTTLWVIPTKVTCHECWSKSAQKPRRQANYTVG